MNLIIIVVIIAVVILYFAILGRDESDKESKRPLPLSDQKTTVTCPNDIKEIIVSIEPIANIFPLKSGETFTLVAPNVGTDFYWDIQTLENQDVVIYPEPGYDEVDVYLNDELIGNSWDGVFDTNTEIE